MTKELIGLDASRTAESQEAGEEHWIPAVGRKASYEEIADGDKRQNVCRRLDQGRRVETEMSERNPLNILPMWSAIKLPPRQADDEQHRGQPEKQHYSPGGIDHEARWS